MPQIDSFARDAFDRLGPEWVGLITECSLPSLRAEPRDEPLAAMLSNSKNTSQWEQLSSRATDACVCGLWLLAGDLDRSHRISQDDGSAEGSFWHAIMHRREGDYGNSKYWFAKVGNHPVLDELPDRCGDLYGDPFSFVDACQKLAQGNAPERKLCEIAQWTEFQSLFAYCTTL